MKRVLITGASGGIGGALCDYFAARDMQVLAHARNDEKARLAAGSRHIPVWGDVTKPEDVADIAKQVAGAGGVDWIVHNAGILSRSTAKGPHGVGIQGEVNVLAPYAITNALSEELAKSGDGRVFVISSTAVMFALHSRYEELAKPNGSSLFGHYALSKSAANALVIAMAKKWPGVFFASTEPGFVDTKMTAGNSDMPFVMSKLAGIIGDKPDKAAKRCFDFLMESKQSSGVVVQGRKVIAPEKARWAKADAQASLEKLFEIAGLPLTG